MNERPFDVSDHRGAARRRLLAAAAGTASTAAATAAPGLRAGLAALGLLGSATVGAQGGPPLRLVVPFAAGTTTDQVARVVGAGFAERLGQTVIVENRPGAGGTIASEQVARAPADGRTLVMGTVGTHAINATLFRRLGYDPVADFAPVAFVGYTPLLLLVAAGSAARTPADLVTAARRADGITFASAGNGTSGHLAGELLAQQGGRMIHVPYKDGAQALTDLMSGNVDFMFYHPTAVLQHLRAGRLRAIGVSSVRPTARVPEARPLAEQGLAGFDLVAWFGLYAPARVPADGLATLRAAAAAALEDVAIRTKLDEQGVETRVLAGDALAGFTKAEVAKWADLVRRSGATVD